MDELELNARITQMRAKAPKRPRTKPADDRYVTIMVPMDQWERLEVRAAARGETVTRFVTYLIEEHGS